MSIETMEPSDNRPTRKTTLSASCDAYSGFKIPNRLLGKRQEACDHKPTRTQVEFSEFIIESDNAPMKSMSVSTGSKPDGTLVAEPSCNCAKIGAYILSLNPSPDNPVKITMTTYKRGTGVYKIGKKTRIIPPLLCVAYYDGIPDGREEIRAALPDETWEKITRMLKQGIPSMLIGVLYNVSHVTISKHGKKIGLGFKTKKDKTAAC